MQIQEKCLYTESTAQPRSTTCNLQTPSIIPTLYFSHSIRYTFKQLPSRQKDLPGKQSANGNTARKRPAVSIWSELGGKGDHHIEMECQKVLCFPADFNPMEVSLALPMSPPQYQLLFFSKEKRQCRSRPKKSMEIHSMEMFCFPLVFAKEIYRLW